MKNKISIFFTVLLLSACGSSGGSCDLVTVFEVHEGGYDFGVKSGVDHEIVIPRPLGLVSNEAWFEIRENGEFVSLGMSDSFRDERGAVRLRGRGKIIFFHIDENELPKKGHECRSYSANFNYIDNGQRRSACPAFLKVCG